MRLYHGQEAQRKAASFGVVSTVCHLRDVTAGKWTLIANTSQLTRAEADGSTGKIGGPQWDFRNVHIGVNEKISVWISAREKAQQPERPLSLRKVRKASAPSLPLPSVSCPSSQSPRRVGVQETEEHVPGSNPASGAGERGHLHWSRKFESELDWMGLLIL